MANKNTVRKLPMKAIQNEYDKYNETTKIDFDIDGKTYQVKFHPYFEPQRVNKMIEQVGKDLNAIYKAKIDFTDQLIPSFLIYHCVAEFSDFPVSRSKDIKVRFSYFYQVINTHYFKAVTENFIQSEFNSVWDKLMELMNTSEKLSNMANKFQNDIQNLDLQSPELKGRLQGKEKRIPEA